MAEAERTYKALVVDDSGVARKILCEHLATRAPELLIDQATNGREAVEQFTERSYDIVFLDLTMPVMDGVEALREIRALGREVVVVMVSASGEERHQRRAARFGASAFIKKPYSALHVAQALRLAVPRPPRVRILIVDDSHVQRRVVQTLLSAALPNVEYSEAADGLEGLREALQGEPDLVFLDQNMPRLNGEHVVQEIKKALPMTKIAILSGESAAAFEDRLMGLGADMILEKPVNPAVLLTQVFSMVDVSAA